MRKHDVNCALLVAAEGLPVDCGGHGVHDCVAVVEVEAGGGMRAGYGGVVGGHYQTESGSYG